MAGVPKQLDDAFVVRGIDPRLQKLGAAALHAQELFFSTHVDGELRTMGRNGSDWFAEGESFKVSDYPLTRKAIEEQTVVQMRVGDEGACPKEVDLLEQAGYRSLLMVPIVVRRETVGLLEAYRSAETLFDEREIERAQFIARQLGARLGWLLSSRSRPASKA